MERCANTEAFEKLHEVEETKFALKMEPSFTAVLEDFNSLVGEYKTMDRDEMKVYILETFKEIL